MQTRTEMQRELEATSVEMGVQKYRETLAERGNAALPAGKQLMLAAMRPMIGAVQEYVSAAEGGTAGRGRGVVNFIAQFDPETVAFLTAQTVVGSLHERPSAARLTSRIGATLEQHMQIDQIAAGNKWLADKIAKLRSQYSEKNHIVILRKVAERNDCQLIEWGIQTRARVGALLLELFMSSTELCTVETLTYRSRREQFVRPTEACRQWLEESHARCELLSPVRLPMLCRPLTWTNPFNGGYLTQRMRQPLVKTRNKNLLSELKHHEMPLVYAAVDALQRTEWAVNESVFALVKDLWESGATAGGLPARSATPMPAKSWSEGEEPDAEVLKAWKWKAKEAHEGNAKAESRRLQLVQKLWVAEQMIARGNLFHFVYNMDWRGRLYPVASGLNPQGDDVAKALLRFRKGVRLGDEGAYWLAIQGANTYGVDKVSFEDRIAWVQEHEADILDAGHNGLNDFAAKADAPFQFFAFCVEYASLQSHIDGGKEQADFVSHLPVAFDGACNGLQNFSAMLRDEVGGAATGLIPDEKPSDIYTVVAQAAQRLIDKDAAAGDAVAERWVGRMTRKLAKRNTMTVPYGVTTFGMRDQLRQEFRKMMADGEGAALSLTPEDAGFLAKKNYEAIGNVVVAARRAMDWLQQVAKVAASNGLPITWTTPVGFLARQDYREAVGDRVDFVALGRRYQFVLERDGDKLDTRRQSLGISPNFVHSLDAAHLIRTVLLCVQDGMEDFAMVHDSYGCHAGHASLLRDNLRQAFVDQYRADTLAEFRDELARQLPEELAKELPPLPAQGKLDLAGVLKSEYFFA